MHNYYYLHFTSRENNHISCDFNTVCLELFKIWKGARWNKVSYRLETIGCKVLNNMIFEWLVLEYIPCVSQKRNMHSLCKVSKRFFLIYTWVTRYKILQVRVVYGMCIYEADRSSAFPWLVTILCSDPASSEGFPLYVTFLRAIATALTSSVQIK